MEAVNYLPEDDPYYQYSAYWPISPAEQFTVPAHSLMPTLSTQKSLLTSQFAQYASLIHQNVPLPSFKTFGPLLHQHQHQRSTSYNQHPSTPALTALSLASTPQTIPSRLVAKSFQYQPYQPSLPHLDFDLRSNQGSPSTSPTESYLDGYSPRDSHTSSGDSDNSLQLFDIQDHHEGNSHCHATVIFNPSHTLHHQPMDVKVNMHEHDEIFDFMPNELHYPLLEGPMIKQYPSQDIKQEVYQSPMYQSSPVFQSSSVYQTSTQGSTTPPSPVDYSDDNSDFSDCESLITPLATSPPEIHHTHKSPVLMKKQIHAARPQIKVVFGPVAKTDICARKVGRRRGPLQPDQRKRASEIRKVRACLRCRFLKKTCDPGTPCSQCQPHHARLWQVPCTRLDVRDLGYFMGDWKNDTQGKITFPEEVNVYGRSTKERTLYIGHGFDIVMPIAAHDVYVYQDTSLVLQWTETHLRTPKDFVTKTACMSVVSTGIDKDMLDKYLDRHIDNGWCRFVDHHFEGTPFLTEMLKTAHNYYLATKLPIIRNALKLVLAYNLTLHISIVQGPIEECSDMIGKINDTSSKYYGKVAAPTLINHHIKHALSRIWRKLHKEVLEELSSMISGVYGRDKLKNWPTIFMVIYLVLSIWEQLRFDAIRRCRDMAEATKFCDELDGVPVGVVVGLFAAISQKLPSFKSWSTFEHHEILGSDPAACNVMEAVREHVLVHGMFWLLTSCVMDDVLTFVITDNYLRSRPTVDYNEENFDSLANKFTSMIIKN